MSQGVSSPGFLLEGGIVSELASNTIPGAVGGRVAKTRHQATILAGAALLPECSLEGGFMEGRAEMSGQTTFHGMNGPDTTENSSDVMKFAVRVRKIFPMLMGDQVT